METYDEMMVFISVADTKKPNQQELP